MIEKLLENWLDSASELSYQPVFVQMLAAEGYTVLHSTRHCLLEFGKDILAIAPDGVGCAFQLKGDPKGRMKIGEFRKDIQPQLVQLLWQAPAYPGFPSGAHRAYLVSNGQYDEEVQTAVQGMNNMPTLARLELWSRGQLLELCRKHGVSLWPGELSDTRSLLELYMSDPYGQFPLMALAEVLGSVLHLGPRAEILNGAALRRAATSACWITGVAVSHYAEKENNQAVALAWTLCCVMLIGAEGKHGKTDSSGVQASLEIAKAAVLDALTSLWKEVASRDHLVEGSPLTDPEVYGWRLTALYGLLSSLAIADLTLGLLSDVERQGLHKWLRAPHKGLDIWGEAAIASLVPWLVWLRKVDATERPDREIAGAANLVIQRNQMKAANPLPSPYYDGESVIRHRLGLEGVASGLLEETFAGGTYTAECLLHMLVRTNQKDKCRAIWPAFTKLGHRGLRFASPWHYCLLRTSEGIDDTKLHPSTYEWKRLKQDVRDQSQSLIVPPTLRACPWLLSMWWQVAPHRLNAAASGVFTESILPDWGT